MKNAYSYIRFSTREQEKGHSKSRQSGGAQGWCERNDALLDTSLKLTDYGVSAFSGEHTKNPDRYALARFLELVRQGDVPSDSYLIIEALDRLTREHIRPALMLFIGLLEAGINVVTLDPEVVYRHDATDEYAILLAIMELMRGHRESARKSMMVGAAWRRKKERAAQEGVPVTAMCPHWLRVEKGKYVEVSERVAVVQRIFQMAVDGTGVGATVRILNREGVKPFALTRRKKDEGKPHLWQKSSVGRILQNRAVVGEYQPHAGHRVRKAVGDPVPDYYPRIVSDTDYWQAQKGKAKRKRSGGRDRTKARSLFTSLVVDAQGHRWSLDNKGGGKVFLANVVGVMCGQRYLSLPYDVFERVVLDWFKEVEPADLLPKPGVRPGAERLAEVRAKITEAEARIEGLNAVIYENPKLKNPPLLLAKAEEELEALQAEHRSALRELSTPLTATVREAQSLTDVLRATPTEELRRKLRAKIAAVVNEIRIAVVNQGGWKFCRVNVLFKDAEYERYITFKYKPARRGRGYEYPEQVVFLGSVDVPEGFDLFHSIDDAAPEPCTP